MLAGNANAWVPLVVESQSAKLRSLLFALLLHAVLLGLLVLAAVNASTRSTQAAGQPMEAVLLLSTPTPTRRTPTPAVRTPPRVTPVPPTPPRVTPVPPKVPTPPKPVAAPPDNVTDQRPVLPKPLPPDPLAIKLAEQEKQREIEEARRQSELEKIRVQREEAEKERKQRERVVAELQAAAKARQLAEEKAALQEAMEQEMQGTGGQANDLLSQYTSILVTVINNAWNRSSGVRPDLYCELLVTQLPGGEVMSAVPQRNCNGSEFERKALVEAVQRASPLPYEGFQSVFRRQLLIPFQPPR